MANYYMLGGDGKEYGPVTVDQLREWISQGRANAQTQVRSEGGSWMAVGTIAELNAPPAGTTPPSPSPAAQFTDAAQPEYSGDVVKRLATTLAAANGWLIFLAVLMFLTALSNLIQTWGLGILWIWVYVWLGILLIGIGSKAKEASLSGNRATLVESLGKMRLYFKIEGILTIIGLVVVVFVVPIFILFVIGAAAAAANR